MSGIIFMKKNFAVVGCGGYIAPRHLQAIKDTGNEVVVALDKSDSVGILDKYFPEASFFTEFETFDRHCEKLRRQGEEKRIHYVSICSPNYLHDAHTRFAFRIGADAICEKPLVINPWNVDALQSLERETGRKVFNVLQLRLHPALLELKRKIELTQTENKYNVDLTYITPRGKWYEISWKGSPRLSGGLSTNLGIHFFDALIWIFGKVVNYEVHFSDQKRIGGYLELERAKVKWFLSIDKNDLPETGANSYRSMKVNNEEIEFSNVFADLHTEVYRKILSGSGLGIDIARPSIDLVHKIRDAKPEIRSLDNVHKLLFQKINSYRRL
jgi:UDP-N-acetyl-2-amino-2-deoxyglucuronate dehydrogenase